MKQMRFVVVTALLSITCIGCSPLGFHRSVEQQSGSALPQEILILHPIRFPGESLSMIASWHTGDQANWERIADYNAHYVKGVIRQGETVRIPLALVVRNEQLPESYVREFNAQITEQNANERAQLPTKVDALTETPEATEDFVRRALEE